MSIETRDLPVPLTNRELRVRADELAKCVTHLKQIKAEKKANAAKYKTLTDEEEARISDLALVVKERKESRPVEVVWEANHERGTMELLRRDTNEAIQVRSMTDKERQRTLFPIEERTEDTSPATADAPVDGADASQQAAGSEAQAEVDPDDDKEAGTAAEDALNAAEKELKDKVDDDLEEDLIDEANGDEDDEAAASE